MALRPSLVLFAKYLKGITSKVFAPSTTAPVQSAVHPHWDRLRVLCRYPHPAPGSPKLDDIVFSRLLTGSSGTLDMLLRLKTNAL